MQLVTLTPEAGGFPRHSHDEYVISVNLHGNENVVLDGRRFEAGVAEVTVYHPGQVQSCTTETDGRPWSCVSLYVPVAEVLSLTGGEPVEFGTPVVAAPGLRRRLLAMRTGGLADAPGLLADLFAAAADTPRPPGPAPGDARIRYLRRRLREDLSAPVRLADLAAEVGLSREQLIRSFTRAAGVPPYAWQLQARVAEGRRLLRQGTPIAAAAAAVGFADQAHFHKHFRAAYGLTPGQFRGRSRSDKTR